MFHQRFVLTFARMKIQILIYTKVQQERGKNRKGVMRSPEQRGISIAPVDLSNKTRLKVIYNHVDRYLSVKDQKLTTDPISSSDDSSAPTPALRLLPRICSTGVMSLREFVTDELTSIDVNSPS